MPRAHTDTSPTKKKGTEPNDNHKIDIWTPFTPTSKNSSFFLASPALKTIPQNALLTVIVKQDKIRCSKDSSGVPSGGKIGFSCCSLDKHSRQNRWLALTTCILPPWDCSSSGSGESTPCSSPPKSPTTAGYQLVEAAIHGFRRVFFVSGAAFSKNLLDAFQVHSGILGGAAAAAGLPQKR